MDKSIINISFFLLVYGLSSSQAQNIPQLAVPNQITNNPTEFTQKQDDLIAQSRNIYTCKSGMNGVSLEPDIFGAIIANDEFSCYIPVSTGQCIALKDPLSPSGDKDPEGFQECNPEIVEHRVTGEKYYKFTAGFEDVTFVIEE